MPSDEMSVRKLLEKFQQEKSADYRNGYVDGIMDFYNQTSKKLEEV